MNIFSYESKFSQTLMFVADLCLLNLLFLLCCIPIFTIGASQSALYSAIRTLQDPEDDTSPFKAFFKAFRTGFKTITLAWGAVSLLLVIMVVVFYYVALYSQVISGAPIWMCIVALAILLVIHSQIPLFHARFSCSVWQLLRNSAVMALAHPIQAVIMTGLIWVPVIAMYFMNAFMLMVSSLAWFLLYYSVAAMLCFNLMKKPYKTLMEIAVPTDTPAEPAADTGDDAPVEMDN